MTIAHVLASGVAPRPSAPRAIYRIVVRDLLLMCRIGIYEHERLAPQRVRINVDLAVSETVGDTGDDIANVYNYEDVISGTKSVIASRHIDLVETLAEEIASHCLKDARVEDVRVRVEKLDVYAEAESVGIEIERRQPKDRLTRDANTAPTTVPLAVIKLGGSLAEGAYLRSWLDQLATLPVLIVPGGGPFAECVRTLQARVGFSDSAAHKMALSSMVQYARMLIDFEPRLQPVSTQAEINLVLSQGLPAIWLPLAIQDHPDIPQSWSVTSDSLAAWLALKTGAARLVLVKSVDLPNDSSSLKSLVDDGLVDEAFPQFMGSLDVSLVQARDAKAAMDAVSAKQSFGTKVIVQ